jgi:hypothetical protein
LLGGGVLKLVSIKSLKKKIIFLVWCTILGIKLKAQRLCVAVKYAIKLGTSGKLFFDANYKTALILRCKLSAHFLYSIADGWSISDANKLVLLAASLVDGVMLRY